MLLTGTVACVGPVEDLPAAASSPTPDAGTSMTNPPPADAGARVRDAASGPSDVGLTVIDAGSTTDPCAPWTADLAGDNLQALHRLGVQVSHTTVEGQLSAATTTADGLRATLEVEAVHHGASFLAGQRYQINLGPHEAASLRLPTRVIVGLSSNPFPVRRDGHALGWADARVVLRADASRSVADLLDYRGDLANIVAVVEIVAQDEDRTQFRVVERIAGELPDTVSTNWTRRVYDAPFPPMGSQRWIATFDHVTFYEAAGLHLGTVTDFREATPAERARVDAALASRRPTFDRDALREASERLRRSWRFNRSPVVVASEVSGVAGECCTGAGGTFIAHDVAATLRGSVDRPRLFRGGHAYYSDEACGDAAILALSELGPPLSHPGDFGCGMTTSLDTSFPTSPVRIERADSPAARAEVERWLAADPPVYRLDVDGAVAPSESSPWSALRSVTQAMVDATHLALVRIVDVKSDADGHVVRFETNFHPREYDHLPPEPHTVAFTCGDPRWLDVGARWIVPVVFDGRHGEMGDAFVVPGVMFPAWGTIERLQYGLQSALR